MTGFIDNDEVPPTNKTEQVLLSRIDFHFSTPRVVVLDLNGVSSATLVRLFQYAEVPIPTSITQGAFSVSFINPGEEGYSNMKADRELIKISVTWGRISALSSVPAQIKLSELQKVERFQREDDDFERWIWDALRGTCPQKVLCFDEESNTDWYMQFHIPAKSENVLPTKLIVDEEAILVEHARPYAVLQTGSIRPPVEETMHEHWKNAARLAPSDRKDRSNFIAHVENNFASLQRIALLQELPISHQGVNYIGTCEMSQFPILFVNGNVTVDRCMCTLIENSSSLPDLQDELQGAYDSYVQDPPIPNDFRCQTPVVYVLSVCSTDHTPVNIGKVVKGSRGLFVSTTELLKCHAYTKCTVAILLPKGIKLELVCTPSRHIEILAKIPVASSPKQSSSIVTQPTPLGVNDTNVAELSQALQSSLSLGTNKELLEQNTCLESQPKASLHAGEDGKERENGALSKKDNNSVPVSPPVPTGMMAKVPPAVSGGTGLQANTQLKVHEHHRDDLITPTATWPLNQNAKPDFADCTTEGPACLTLEAKPREVDNSNDLLKKGQAVRKHPLIPAHDDEELRRSNDGKEQALEVIAEIPDAIHTIVEYCQQDAEESSPVQLVSEGKRSITSISQTLDKIANFPIQENSPPPQPNAVPSGNSQVNKQSDELGTHKVATYFPHSTVPNEILAARPSGNSFEGTPLSTPFEQNDKDMPKARRSQSVGQFPSTPNKHKVGHGNSKSCPPGRHKSSPPKDMVKKPSKGGKEISILSDFFQPKGGKATVAKYPQSRADIPHPTVTANEPHNVATCVKSRSTDVPMIDLESIINEEDKRAHELILAKEIRIQAAAAQLVRDAGEKWLSQVPGQKRNDIEKLAIQFLLAMDSTLCFFTVSLRMIALAPWKDTMVAIDVRQAAVVAISKGWFVKSEPFSAYPFSRAELALAAGSYLGKITPTLADDATVALRAIVELLPIVCDEFFAQVSLACPFCQAKAVGAAPIFSTAVTWKSDEWVDLKTTPKRRPPLSALFPRIGIHLHVTEKILYLQ